MISLNYKLLKHFEHTLSLNKKKKTKQKKIDRFLLIYFDLIFFSKDSTCIEEYVLLISRTHSQYEIGLSLRSLLIFFRLPILSKREFLKISFYTILLS